MLSRFLWLLLYQLAKLDLILSFRITVAAFAHKYLSEFVIKDVKWQFKWIQCVVILNYCEIEFWWYKAEMGCSIRPMSSDGTIRYQKEMVTEIFLPLVGLLGAVPMGATPRAVEQQMKLIKQEHRKVLEGNFGDWPHFAAD